MDVDTAADRFEWERIMRRCILPSTVKLVAFALGTFADQDGTRVYPGVALLVRVTGLSERSVRNALKNLREIGLIERVYKGGRHGVQGFTDVHRLAIPVDLLERVEMLTVREEAPPNRHEVPPGTSSQPAPGSSQPATDDPQPATDDPQPASDDTPTGTRCTPPSQLPTTYQPTDQRDHHLEDVTTDRARHESDIDFFVLQSGNGAP